MTDEPRQRFLSIGRLILLAVGACIIAFIAFKAIGQTGHDIQFSHYANLPAVRQSSMIERGWVPEFLPTGSTEISETHNLDTNIGTGTFKFPSAELDAFKAQASQLVGAEVKEENNISYFVYTRERSRFMLVLCSSKLENVMIGVWNVRPVR